MHSAKVVENELRLIVADQGANVTEIVELVRENETILDAMKHNLRESFVAEMARLILRSDTDGDMTVDPQEGELLALRLSIQLKPHGITLDVLQFEQLLKEDNDVGSLLKFCSEVLYPEIALEKSKKQTAPLMGEEESDISEEDDFFAPSPSKENALPDFAFFCKKLSMLSEDDLIDECDNVKMTVEDKLSIFSIDSKYSGGSVEVARGRKMSIFPGSQLKKESRASQMVVEAKKISAAAIDRRKTRGMAEF
ncbi:hypothetical protein ACHAWO_005917 [Cyclotella atomus]|uniref:Uncharacterized protein n=1 Tax=Cyclotella atomus TaxID=382360 RepID=A0ABD3NKY4_9STRA